MNSGIVGLSLTQPWATLIAIGAKEVETRSWPTSYRGLVAIHASKSIPGWAKELVEDDDTFTDVLSEAGYNSIKELPLGAIVAVARLRDCVRTESIRKTISSQERIFGDYGGGRYGFVLSDIVALPAPIPARGSLSLWQLTDDVLTQLMPHLQQVAA